MEDVSRSINAIEKEIFIRLAKYCAYQERCSQEAKRKMMELGLPAKSVPAMLARLEEERFLDDIRFAQQFAHGKFSIKSWGRIKIRHELQGKDIAQDTIEAALRSEIDEDAYLNTARQLALRKAQELGDLDEEATTISAISRETRDKITRYLLQKGYEWDIIRAVNS